MRTRLPEIESLVVWWAECVDLLDQLTPYNRARALVLITEEIHEALATMPDREHVPPWLINQLLRWDVSALLPREWAVVEGGEGCVQSAVGTCC